jgi:hypothetical protein
VRDLHAVRPAAFLQGRRGRY